MQGDRDNYDYALGETNVLPNTDTAQVSCMQRRKGATRHMATESAVHVLSNVIFKRKGERAKLRVKPSQSHGVVRCTEAKRMPQPASDKDSHV